MLPFGLGGQTLAGPCREGRCFEEAHVDNRRVEVDGPNAAQAT